MTDVVIEVGPETIRGPNDALPQYVSAALDCIDDGIALLNDAPVSVDDVWHQVMVVVAGQRVDTIVLVCPTWWSSSRIDRVRAAAHTVAGTVAVLQRTPLLRRAASDRPTTIVELARELAVVTHPGARSHFIPRGGSTAEVAEAVAAAVGNSARALVDAPAGVDDAGRVGAAIADRMRGTGVGVTFADDQLVRREAMRSRERVQPNPDADARPRPRRRRAAAVLAGVASAAAAAGGAALYGSTADVPVGDMTATLLVEGRVGVVVPAAWTVHHVTSGPGSARVQIVSPSDTDVVVHLTQSAGVPEPTLGATADSLRAALDDEPDGVFVEFNPSDRRAGREAVTYREMRPHLIVTWVVLIDDSVRIAIGCQSPPEQEHLVRDVCDQAIRSAHAVF